ncbi:MAG: phosphatidylinositol transfer protein [Deltaproteobacteria bacterium]|nr:phosphatidylinositol transfer protein [Deltaproteobacteria bacterium]
MIRSSTIAVLVALLCLAPAPACRGGEPSAPAAAPAAIAGSSSQTSPGCGKPVPFPEPGGTTAWRHTRTGLFTVPQGAAAHRGQDLLVVEGNSQWLIGKFAYGPADKDLEDEEVEIWVQENAPCGGWEQLATVRTTKDGPSKTVEGVENDGGRVFFEIPGSKRLPLGVHAVRMRVRGDSSHADFKVIVARPGTQVVVFDVDGTLTTGDSELIKEIIGDLIHRRNVPELRAGGPAAARAWRDKGYLVLYLTGRPDLLYGITREWLVDKGFPPGVLHLTDTLHQAAPDEDGVGAYKTAFLELLARRGFSFAAAYGNATTDIQAYAAANIPKDRTFIAGKHGGESATTALSSYSTHAEEFVGKQPEAAVKAPQLDW